MKTWFCPALMLLVAAGHAGAVQPSDTPARQNALDLRQYIAELENESAAAKRLKDHPEEAARLRAELPPEWVVTTNGQRYSVPTTWLKDRINALESDRSRAAAISGELAERLDAMSAGAQAMSGDQAISMSAARTKLDSILKRGEFRGVAGPGPIRSWWDRVTDWLADKLTRFFTMVGRHGSVPTTFVWLLTAVAALLLLAWLIRSILRVSRTTRFKLESPPARERDDWGRLALDCADRGEYREAIHLAYRLALAKLEESGLVKTDRSRTPREYVGLLPDGNSRRRPFSALTARFERAWYAGRAVSTEDFLGALAELGDLGCHLVWSRATADFS